MYGFSYHGPRRDSFSRPAAARARVVDILDAWRQDGV